MAKEIIENFNDEIKNFVKVLPLDFKEALKKVKVETILEKIEYGKSNWLFRV